MLPLAYYRLLYGNVPGTNEQEANEKHKEALAWLERVPTHSPVWKRIDQLQYSSETELMAQEDGQQVAEATEKVNAAANAPASEVKDAAVADDDGSSLEESETAETTLKEAEQVNAVDVSLESGSQAETESHEEDGEKPLHPDEKEIGQLEGKLVEAKSSKEEVDNQVEASPKVEVTRISEKEEELDEISNEIIEGTEEEEEVLKAADGKIEELSPENESNDNQKEEESGMEPKIEVNEVVTVEEEEPPSETSVEHEQQALLSDDTSSNNVEQSAGEESSSTQPVEGTTDEESVSADPSYKDYVATEEDPVKKPVQSPRSSSASTASVEASPRKHHFFNRKSATKSPKKHHGLFGSRRSTTTHEHEHEKKAKKKISSLIHFWNNKKARSESN